MLTERQKPEQATALGSGVCSTPDTRHRCFTLDEALHLSVPSAPLGFLCSDCKAASAGADSYPVSALSPEPCHHNCAWKIHVLLWINNRSCARGTEISQFDTTVLAWGMKTPRPQVIPPWWKKIKISICLCSQEEAFAYFQLIQGCSVHQPARITPALGSGLTPRASITSHCRLYCRQAQKRWSEVAELRLCFIIPVP